MKITFTNNVSSNDHLVFITFDKNSTFKSKFLDKTKKDLITGFLNQKNKDNGNIFKPFFTPQLRVFRHFLLLLEIINREMLS